MGLLTRDVETRILKWLLINSDDSNLPVEQPVVARLMATNGNATSPGTEITGDVYSPAEVSWGISAEVPGVSAINGLDVTFIALDSSSAKTVVGVELWDSSDTPIRIGYAALDSAVTIAAGDPFSVAPGQLKVKLT